VVLPISVSQLARITGGNYCAQLISNVLAPIPFTVVFGGRINTATVTLIWLEVKTLLVESQQMKQYIILKDNIFI
jgi:hypothetical protein